MKLTSMFFTSNAYFRQKNCWDTDATDLTDLHRWGCSFAPFIVIVVRKGGALCLSRQEVGKTKVGRKRVSSYLIEIQMPICLLAKNNFANSSHV